MTTSCLEAWLFDLHMYIAMTLLFIRLHHKGWAIYRYTKCMHLILALSIYHKLYPHLSPPSGLQVQQPGIIQDSEILIRSSSDQEVGVTPTIPQTYSTVT